MWQIKNPEIEKKILVFFTREEIDLACEKQINDEFSYVTFTKEDCCLGFNEVSFEIDKRELEKVEKYDPRAWNDFSKVKPPKTGCYLISNLDIRDYPSEGFVAYWNGKDWIYPSPCTTQSFRAMPTDDDLGGFWDTKGL